MSSHPRPIPTPRVLNKTPDEAEPSFSYERESFMDGGKHLDVEDEFHRRLAGSRNSHSHGNSFWRTSTTNGEAAPSFASVKFAARSEGVKTRNGSASLGSPLQSLEDVDEPVSRDHVSFFLLRGVEYGVLFANSSLSFIYTVDRF